MSDLAERERGFDAFVRDSSRGLLRVGWLLTGDWATAEDLVQTALVTTWRKWRTIRRADRPAVYVHRVMMTTYLGWRRRRWTGEVPSADMPDRAAGPDEFGRFDLQQSLRSAMHRLPPKQRATITLRYFLDLSERATADALGCSLGTVKSNAARAIATLRTDPNLAALLDEGVIR